MEKSPRICIITIPRSDDRVSFALLNLVDILSNLGSELYLIAGEEGNEISRLRNGVGAFAVPYQPGKSLLTRILNYLIMQLRVSLKLLRWSGKVDLCIFFLAEALFLPVLTARLLGKKPILSLGSSSAKIGETYDDPLVYIFMFLESLNYRVSNGIILYSPNLIEEWNLGKYRNKILVARRHFLDLTKFKVLRPFEERECLVGCAGRLSPEKGVQNFLDAIPKVLAEKSDVRFLIGGDGQLRSEVERYSNQLTNKIEFKGWIPHETLPEYFNKLKLFVLPSHTEGLPNTMIESMACGTPVLATPVGVIKEIIKDGKNGFIMEDNSSECIARNIIRALNSSNLEEIAQNARTIVEKEFTYQAAVADYRLALAKFARVYCLKNHE